MELFTDLAGASLNYEDVYYRLEDKLHKGFPTMKELEKVVARISDEEIYDAMMEAGYEIIDRAINDYIKEVQNA